MILELALRNLLLRPWRTAFLLVGYGFGVATMIVLLAIGEALVGQARDEKLVGGGDVTVLPEGIDIEVLKTGGLGGMFFSIDHARFIYRQLLAAPRAANSIAAAAPQIEGKLLYLRTLNGREVPVLAGGEIPSRSALVGAAASLAAGKWVDDEGSRRWRDPTMAELRHEIDRFHLPPPRVAGDSTWAEWHYFNVLWPDAKRWAFISFIVAGQVPDGRWGGQVLVTVHEQDRPARRFTAIVPSAEVRFSTSDADVTIGQSSVEVLQDGRYQVRARAYEDGSGDIIDVALIVTPSPGAYFPGAALGGDQLVSGYVVPALRAEAMGRVCIQARCETLDGVQGYHDHNWGTWRGVTWEWGAARAGAYTFLFGRVQPEGTEAATQLLFVYVVDSLGFVGLFRPREVIYENRRTVTLDGRVIRVPSSGVMVDVRGDDTLRVEMSVEDAAVTDTRRPLIERGEAGAARAIARPYFVQMKGRATIAGRIRGVPLTGSGAGFFETYR